MTDQVSNLRQVLAQTQAVQKTQETARRKGDVQQQQTARQIVDKVDIQGHQVEEAPDAREKKVDPEARRGDEEESPERREGEREPEQEAAPQGGTGRGHPADPPDEDDGKGRMIDRTA